jgi:AcrR family transcriptional regulator
VDLPQSDDPRPAGRPRAQDLEERALRAAREEFGEKGWTGLSIAGVASRARVGKSSIYLRWPDKAALLADALRGVQAAPMFPDIAAAGDAPAAAPAGGTAGVTADAAEDAPGGTTGGTTDAAAGPDDGTTSLRDFLVAHARRRADLYLGPDGLAMLRLYVEARAFPEPLAEVRHEAITRFVLSERQRVERAVQQGELPAAASAVHLLDAIEGSVLMHVLVTPPHLLDRVRRTLPEYVERMVDLQLGAVAVVAGEPRTTEAPGA